MQKKVKYTKYQLQIKKVIKNIYAPLKVARIKTCAYL